MFLVQHPIGSCLILIVFIFLGFLYWDVQHFGVNVAKTNTIKQW